MKTNPHPLFIEILPVGFCALLSAIALCVPPISAHADPTEWTGAIDDDFFKAGNWTEGVPVSEQLAEFHNDGTTVTVDFAASATFGGVKLFGTNNAVVVFELNGNDLNLDLPGTEAFFNNTTGATQDRTLTVRSGTLVPYPLNPAQKAQDFKRLLVEGLGG